MEEIPEKVKGPRPWKPVVIGFSALAVVFAGYVLWLAFLGPEAARYRETQKNLQIARNFQSAYETAMTNDTYGGKTPQETLDLFIAALKQGDVDLASKYFVLKPDGTVDENVILGLKNIQQGKDGFGALIEALLNAKPDLEARISEDYFVFVSVNEKNEIITEVDMRLNKYSGIWKIESM